MWVVLNTLFWKLMKSNIPTFKNKNIGNPLLDILRQDRMINVFLTNSLWPSSSVWDLLYFGEIRNKPVKPICPGHCVPFNQESWGCNVTDPELGRLFISIMADHLMHFNAINFPCSQEGKGNVDSYNFRFVMGRFLVVILFSLYFI